jgi:hypothetical protein
MELLMRRDTFFKSQPLQANELAETDRLLVEQGRRFEIEHWEQAEDQHLKVRGNINGWLDDWFVFEPHVQVIEKPTRLTTLQPTVFKARPLQAGQLEEAERWNVAAGQQYAVAAHLPSANSHLLVQFTEPVGAAPIGPRESWHVFAPHVRIEGELVNLMAANDTIIKARPEMSSRLAAHETIVLRKGTALALEAFEEASNGHLKLVFANPIQGRQHWYAWKPDVSLLGNEPDNQPKKEVPPPQPKGPSIQLPGYSSLFYLRESILPGGHFTWGEATKNGSRLPTNRAAAEGILRIAQAMEQVRERLGGRAITVTSWYRDPATNRRVGGASRSRHLVGDAVDFVVPGIHPYDVYDRLDSWWGRRGGLASATVFTHIDTRGYYARWSYGF